jgi:hypothetical protein
MTTFTNSFSNIVYIVMFFGCACLQTGYGLVNGFIDHLYKLLGITINYKIIADFYTTNQTTLTLLSLPPPLVAWQ